jgi:asparagine synthetase B (glutamine-hydrolysing)
MSSIPNKYTRYVNARRILKFGHMLQHKKNSKLNYHSLFMSAVNIDQQKITKFEKDIIDDLDLEKNFDSSNGLRKFHHLEKIMNEDIINYLPDDILYKVDRAAMSESLETRIPFLNHKIVEFAQSLPIKFKYNRVHGKKIILKRLLSRKIPIELFDRPKKGFGAPIENWLRGPLREWMFDSLSTSELKKTNIFNEEVIAKILSNFMKNNSVQVQLLWNIIILQKWMISNNMSY